LGLGVAILFDEKITSLYEVLPAATVGFRFQKPGRQFVFRTGLVSPDGVYVSLGCAF
jgi:hypothetical protein